MSRRGIISLLVGVLIGLAVLWVLRLDRSVDRAVPQRTESEPLATAVSPPVDVQSRSPLADDLNSPRSTPEQDVRIVREIFAHWRTNLKDLGNPVGTNAEITAALTGDNPLDLAFVPPDHPAINEHGELCDRWGAPFRFHQISGTVMEIISAGPDRTFATEDDISIR